MWCRSGPKVTSVDSILKSEKIPIKFGVYKKINAHYSMDEFFKEKNNVNLEKNQRNLNETIPSIIVSKNNKSK